MSALAVVVEKLIYGNSRKIHRARMAYKRFSWTGETFSITGFDTSGR